MSPQAQIQVPRLANKCLLCGSCTFLFLFSALLERMAAPPPPPWADRNALVISSGCRSRLSQPNHQEEGEPHIGISRVWRNSAIRQQAEWPHPSTQAKWALASNQSSPAPHPLPYMRPSTSSPRLIARATPLLCLWLQQKSVYSTWASEANSSFKNFQSDNLSQHVSFLKTQFGSF